MTEAADFDPGPWRGHDFGAARARYDTHAVKSHEVAKASGKTVRDLVPPSISTNSRNPLVIISDETGSMGKWPGIIFSKLGYMDHELRTEYLGEDMEVSFAAFGDAHNGEDYPLQVRPFTKGLDMQSRLEELVIEGQGGGQTYESSELAALYYARNVSMPNAIRPILIFITDEKPYDYVDSSQALQYAHVSLHKSLSTKQLFRDLKNQYSVYLVLKPYGNNTADNMDSISREVHSIWFELLGEDHIAILPQADRVVDVIFGILAKEVGRVDYFKREIEGRQKPEQITTVYKSLSTVHALPPGQAKVSRGRSIMHKPII